MSNIQRQQYYHLWAIVFLTFSICKSFSLIVLVAFNLLLEAWIDLGMMALTGSMLVYSSWRLKKLKETELR